MLSCTDEPADQCHHNDNIALYEKVISSLGTTARDNGTLVIARHVRNCHGHCDRHYITVIADITLLVKLNGAVIYDRQSR